MIPRNYELYNVLHNRELDAIAFLHPEPCRYTLANTPSPGFNVQGKASQLTFSLLAQCERFDPSCSLIDSIERDNLLYLWANPRFGAFPDA